MQAILVLVTMFPTLEPFSGGTFVGQFTYFENLVDSYKSSKMRIPKIVRLFSPTAYYLFIPIQLSTKYCV